MNCLFLKWAKTQPLFKYRSLHTTNIAQILYLNDKSVDGVLGTQTRGDKMVGANESTEQLTRLGDLLNFGQLFKAYGNN